MTQISETVSRLYSAKSSIYSAILQQGGTVSASIGFEGFASAIRTIPTIPSATLTASAGDILSPKTAFANNSVLTGTILTHSKADTTIIGQNVNVLSGYYSSAYTYTIPSGSYGSLSMRYQIYLSSIVAWPVIERGVSGYNSMEALVGYDICIPFSALLSRTTASASDILYGKKAYGSNGSLYNGTMSTYWATYYTPGRSSSTITAKYISTLTIRGDSNLAASNIVSGISIFNIMGNAQTAQSWLENLPSGDQLDVINLCRRFRDYACYGLSNVTTVANSVCSSIGTGAFQNCSNASIFIFNSSSMVNLVNSNAFNGCYNSYKVYVPTSLYSSYLTATNWSRISSHLGSYPLSFPILLADGTSSILYYAPGLTYSTIFSMSENASLAERTDIYEVNVFSRYTSTPIDEYTYVQIIEQTTGGAHDGYFGELYHSSEGQLLITDVATELDETYDQLSFSQCYGIYVTFIDSYNPSDPGYTEAVIWKESSNPSSFRDFINNFDQYELTILTSVSGTEHVLYRGMLLYDADGLYSTIHPDNQMYPSQLFTGEKMYECLACQSQYKDYIAFENDLLCPNCGNGLAPMM